jgi:hypothetical protein
MESAGSERKRLYFCLNLWKDLIFRIIFVKESTYLAD